jgi:hypothetical protein
MDPKLKVHVKCLVCIPSIYRITNTWAYTIMKNRQNMCTTQRKGEHTCFTCEESASNWASNHSHNWWSKLHKRRPFLSRIGLQTKGDLDG